jgi:hypothetical protein
VEALTKGVVLLEDDIQLLVIEGGKSQGRESAQKRQKEQIGLHLLTCWCFQRDRHWKWKKRLNRTDQTLRKDREGVKIPSTHANCVETKRQRKRQT